jgi:hypothetical protein
MSAPAEFVVYELSRHEWPLLIVKAATSGLAIEAVRNAVQVVVPGAPNGGLSSLDIIQAQVNQSLRLWRVTTLSGTLCALLAGLILAIGFFGILSLQIAEREREIGIRIALGANLVDVSAALLKRLGPAVAVGLALGSAGAFLAGAKLTELYQLSAPRVIACYLASLVLLGFLLLAAAAVPLSRAFAISLVDCLSTE